MGKPPSGVNRPGGSGGQVRRRCHGGRSEESCAVVPCEVRAEPMVFTVFLVSADRCRVAGEEPWASARMRCFIVGGSARSRGRVHRTEGPVAVARAAGVCSGVVAADSVFVV